jgi:hypothetical protein
MSGVVRFGVGFDGPGWRVLHAPVSDRMWASGGARVVDDGAGIWIVAGQVAWFVPDTASDVVVRDGRALVRDEEDRRTVVEAPVRTVDRSGLDQAVRWDGEWAAAGLRLPVGARHAIDLVAWPAGRGVSWSDLGTLYALDADGARAVAALGPEERWRAEAHGGHLFGDDDHWLRYAPPGRSARPLPVPLVDAHVDGDGIVGFDPEGDPAALTVPAGRPLWSVHRRSPAPTWAWALRGATLLGPGGRRWDLATGASEPAPVRDGAVAFVGDTWVTASKDGRVWWADTGAEVHVDVGRDEVDGASPLGPDVLLRTARGKGFRVTRDAATRLPGRHDAPDPDPDPDLPVDVDATAVIAGRTFAWRADGLVVFGSPLGA